MGKIIATIIIFIVFIFVAWSISEIWKITTFSSDIAVKKYWVNMTDSLTNYSINYSHHLFFWSPPKSEIDYDTMGVIWYANTHTSTQDSIYHVSVYPISTYYDSIYVIDTVLISFDARNDR